MMKSFMNHIQDRGHEEEDSENEDQDLFQPFSDALLGYTMKSESVWALDNIDESLFRNGKL